MKFAPPKASLLSALACVGLAAASCSGTLVPPDDFSACTASEGDGGLDVTEVSVDGEMLSVSVSHGGGCETHQYAICWPTQGFEGTDPKRTSFELWHDNAGDNCEAYLSEELSFPLGPVLDAYREEFGEVGTLEMMIEDMGGSYDFEG